MKVEMAFPSAKMSSDGERIIYESEGMTLRDYFAGQAAIGLCMAGSTYPANFIAKISYQLADAMLEARK